MPSTAELYNHEVLEGHREAVAALRELLAAEKDPLERRKLANALLRAKPLKLAEPPKPKAPPTPRPAAPSRDPLLNIDIDDDWDEDDREAQRVIDNIRATNDPSTALDKLRALMADGLNAIQSTSRTTESS